MYFYIMDPSSKQICVLPDAPRMNSVFTSEAHVIIAYNEDHNKFAMIKNRFGFTAEPDKAALKWLGIRLFDDGFWVSDKEKMLFLLKYSGLRTKIVVDFPLIPMYNTNTEETG